MVSPILGRLKKDAEFRIQLFLFLSFLFNFSYASFLFVVSRVYNSRWFFVMSIYYALLSLLRVFIFFHVVRAKKLRKRIRMIRACGYFLFLVNLAVSTMMFVLIYTAPHVKQHEITVITLATYTFSALTFAIVSGIKYVKKKNYAYTCVKVMSLISASVSLVTLTNTMLATFGDGDTSLRRIVLPLLSGVVAILIVVCAVVMIVKSEQALRKIKNEKE